MAFDAYLYGNPETVLERKQEIEAKQARACGQCIHKRSVEYRGEVGHFCEFKRHVYGKRCELYQIK